MVQSNSQDGFKDHSRLPEHICPRIEWEALQRPWRVDTITEKGRLHPGVDSITLSRGDDYQIVARLFGSHAKMFDSSHEIDLSAGKIIPPSTISGVSEDTIDVTLSRVYPGDVNIRGDGLLEGTALVGNIEFKHPNTSIPCWMSVWCLNGPGSLFGSRSTKRSSFGKVVRTRKGLASDSPEHELEVRISDSHGFGNDYWIVKTSSFSVRLCMVPTQLGPTWSRNYVLEYSMPQSGISAESGYENALEGIGFVLGKQLMPIGITVFDCSGYPIRQGMSNPLGKNVKGNCQRPAMPPIPFRDQVFLSEELLSDLTEGYCRRRDELDLRRAMWHFWQAGNVPLEESLVILSISLETMMRAWYRSTSTKSKAMHVRNDEWNSLVADLYKTLKKRIGDRQFADSVLNKIKNANKMGVSEQVDQFFQEIGLMTNSYESSILRSRNRFAHGGNIEYDEYQLLMEAKRAYETLIYRIILRLIGYDGQYIDYSTYGFPPRKLSDPMLGGNGDGTPLPL